MNRRKKHHARSQITAEPPLTAFFLSDSPYVDPCLHLFSTPPLSSFPNVAVVEGFICILYSRGSLSSKIVSVQAKSEQGGWISGGGTQRRFIRGGSAPRCNPLLFYIAF